jgi:hypothetical protein
MLVLIPASIPAPDNDLPLIPISPAASTLALVSCFGGIVEEWGMCRGEVELVEAEEAEREDGEKECINAISTRTSMPAAVTRPIRECPTRKPISSRNAGNPASFPTSF